MVQKKLGGYIVKIKEKVEKAMGRTEKWMRPEFVERFSFHERMLLSIMLYVWSVLEMAILLCEVGVRAIAKGAVHTWNWICRCAKKVSHATKDPWNRACMRAVGILVILLMVCGLIVYANIDHTHMHEQTTAALENVKIEYVKVNKGEGEFLWRTLAEAHCPDYMMVTNWDCECNYLALLYDYNGGYHVLQEGEMVAIPILPN